MKTKSNLKLLIVMSILLLAMCIFNANVVEATNQTKTPQEILNLVPDTVEVDMLESEVFTDNQDFEKLNKSITKTFTDNKIDLKALNLQYTNLSVTDLYEDIHKATIYLSSTDKNNYEPLAKKNITIKYKNTSTYNEKDKNYVLEKVKNLPSAIAVSNNSADYGENEFQKSIENIINDKNVKVIINYGAFGSTAGDIVVANSFVALYKNNVLYKTMGITSLAFETITIPDNVQDTDEAYINYALPKIKEIWNSFEVSNVRRITGKVDEENNITNNGTYYIMTLNGSDSARVVLKKSNTKKILDNVAISNSSATINGTNIDKTSSIYAEMLSKAKEKGFNNIFNAYELKLASGNISNGLTITFSLGTENNGKQALILHKKANGSYEEFTETVENGKVNIKVTELSPFMVALKDKTTTATTPIINNNRKLDNEPKTGVVNYTLLASIIALISLGGIVVLKLKK